MPIATAIQKGTTIYVYDEKNHQLFTRSVSSSDRGLLGYTSTTVSIQKGSIVYTYDQKGRQMYTRSA